MNQTRHTAGAPASQGGQFKATARSEAGVHLSPRVERVPLDVARLEEHSWFHITPTENLDSLVSDGVRQGDGRHWKGRAQYAVYLTDAAGVFSWMKEIRRRGGGTATDFSVVGVDLDSHFDMDDLARRRFAEVADTTHGLQMRLSVDEIPAEALDYLGDTSRKPRGWQAPPPPAWNSHRTAWVGRR